MRGLAVFITQHENEQNWPNQAPMSSEVCSLLRGTVLVACGTGPSHWVVRHLGPYKECEEQRDLLRALGWEKYLARWNTKKQEKDNVDV